MAMTNLDNDGKEIVEQIVWKVVLSISNLSILKTGKQKQFVLALLNLICKMLEYPTIKYF
jgi:DNA-binding Xre family transcriptional regulator